MTRGPVQGPHPACSRRRCSNEARWLFGGECWDCWEKDRERQRAKSRRSAEVRNPPRPPFEKVAGACSLCGTTDLPPRRRSWCSDLCVDTWNLATSAAYATRQLIDLHGDRCWSCDRTEETVEVERWLHDADSIDLVQVTRPVTLFLDHVRPLWLLTVDEAAELRWWLPYNLQLLCGPCHGRKTRSEARLRALIRAKNPGRLR